MTRLKAGDQFDESQSDLVVHGGPKTRIELGDQHDSSRRHIRLDDRHLGATKPGDMESKVWVIGAFWLVALLTVAVVVVLISRGAPIALVPIALLAGLLFFCVLSASLLRTLGGLGEKSFLELMRMAISMVPLLGKRVRVRGSAEDP